MSVSHPTTTELRPAVMAPTGVFEWICMLSVAASACFGPLDISEGDSTNIASVGLDPQVLLKLGVSGIAFLVGAWGVLFLPRARTALVSIPGIAVLGLAGLFFASSLTAISSASLPAAMIFLGYVMFVPTTLAALGLRRFCRSMLAGMLAYLVLGWFVYLCFPAYGVFSELLPDGLVVQRMSGAAHPNVFARSAVFGILVSTYLFRVRELGTASWMGCLLFMGLTAYLTWSRTSLMACGAGFVILWLDQLFTRRGAYVMAALCGLAFTGVFALIATGNGGFIQDKLIGLATKTGDVEEVTSATGRTEIWAESIRLIAARPWLGYGINSAPLLLIDHSQHTHNIVLNPAMMGGIGAGFLLCLILLWNGVVLLGHPNLFLRAICIFILISGPVEDTILETFPAPSTLLWLVATLWPTLGDGSPERDSEYNVASNTLSATVPVAPSGPSFH